MWIRERGASSSAAAAASMSVGLERQSEAIVARSAARATAWTPSKSPGERGGEARLDHVDTESLELLADLDLLVRPQGDARRLLAVS